MEEIKVGIMGGTFNPIHFGHLIIAENAFDYYNLNYVIFIPSGDPPHKKEQEIISKEHRLIMTSLGIEDNNHFDVSKIEVDKKGYSYTVETLLDFKKENPNNTYYFIIGSDSLFQLTTWKNSELLFTLCHFIVALREDYNLDEVKNVMLELEEQYKAKIHLLPMPIIEISSSEIRNRVKDGKTIKYFVPKDIEHYIYTNNLYKN